MLAQPLDIIDAGLGQYDPVTLLQLQQTDAANIVALVRNPDNAGSLTALGIEVRQADYNQPQTLTAALTGVQQLLLISSSEVGQRVEQHQAVIDAASQAQVLLHPHSHIGQTYELAGDQGFTLAGYAAEIARQTADAVSYRNLEQAEYAALLQQFGLPQGFAAALADAEACAAEGWLADDSQTLSRLLGRPTIPMADSVRQALS